jgi:hypothetical protein
MISWLVEIAKMPAANLGAIMPVPHHALLAIVIMGAGPIDAGLKPGQRPGPYTALVSVGPQRGQLHCFICETADRPAVIVFARSLSEPLGRLVRGLDQALLDHKGAELRAWVTFLAADQPAFDPQVVRWGRDHAIRTVPLGVFEDTGGPPAYRLDREADVTVLLAVKQKVVRAFAFRAGELDARRTAEVLQGLLTIVPPRK